MDGWMDGCPHHKLGCSASMKGGAHGCMPCKGKTALVYESRAISLDVLDVPHPPFVYVSTPQHQRTSSVQMVVLHMSLLQSDELWWQTK